MMIYDAGDKEIVDDKHGITEFDISLQKILSINRLLVFNKFVINKSNKEYS